MDLLFSARALSIVLKSCTTFAALAALVSHAAMTVISRDNKLVQDVEQKALRLNMGVFWHLFASQRKRPGDSSFVDAPIFLMAGPLL